MIAAGHQADEILVDKPGMHDQTNSLTTRISSVARDVFRQKDRPQVLRLPQTIYEPCEPPIPTASIKRCVTSRISANLLR
jgi:hypothetical protein